MRALEKDSRINKPRFSDIDAAYKELRDYQSTGAFRNVERAKGLLRTEWETTNDQLKDAMQRSYGLTDNDNTTLEELANTKDVDVRLGTFDKRIKLRLK